MDSQITQSLTTAPRHTAATDDWSTLLAEIRSRAASGEFDSQRHVSPDIIARLKVLGVFRALVPARFGGDAQSPRAFCERVEALAEADGSVGWVASFGVSPVYLSALPLETLQTIYAQGPDRVFAGGVFPSQPALRTAQGLRINGRWHFSSGCATADLFGVGITLQESDGPGKLRMALLSRDQVTIEETWNTVGLAGTGSHDLLVHNALVPESWTFVRGGGVLQDEALFRYPPLALATQVLSVVALGVARRALSEVRASAEQVSFNTGAPGMADRPYALMEIARGEARLRSARAFFYETLDQAWQRLLAGDEVDAQHNNLLRLSCTHAVREAAEVCRQLQILSGMSGVERTHPLARCVNDTLVITQHAFMGDVTWQNAGAMFCGRAPLPGYL